MRKAIEKIMKVLIAVASAYKEAAPYMNNIRRYDCPNLQIVY